MMNMRKRTQWIGIPLLFAALLAASFFLGRVTTKDETAAATRHETPASEREVLYWRAPMDPAEIYDQPGKSLMGMDLIPVYADEAEVETDRTVSIDPTTVQNMGVRTTSVMRMDLSQAIRTVGKIEYDEEALYLVNTKISGWIEELHVDFVGESVREGDPLLEIYSPELVTTQQEYLLALKNFEQVAASSFPSAKEDAEQLLESTRQRLEYWDIPSSEIERLEQTGEVRKTVLLRAPASGIVVEKHVVEGAHVQPGMDLYQIADLSTVWVHASIYDNELPWVTEGQAATMELSYLPGQTYRGRVSYIYPFLREEARDVHVRLIFNNPDLSLKPSMYVNVQLQGRTIEGTMVVPSEAVLRSGERTIVFVVREPGKFESREVQVGEEGGPAGRYVRVISGLSDGEEVVTSAQFMLDSESRLQEVIQKMMQEREQQPVPDTHAAMPDTAFSAPDPHAGHHHH